MPPLQVCLDRAFSHASAFLPDNEPQQAPKQGLQADKPTPVSDLRRPKFQSQERHS
jgi:hypothetical protein